jgi:hypothetical protein
MEVRPVRALLYHIRGMWTDGWTSSRDKAKCRFSQFRERAYKFVSAFCVYTKKTQKEGGGGGGERWFAHLQAASSLCRNRGLVIEITSHELTGTDFVMESV